MAQHESTAWAEAEVKVACSAEEFGRLPETLGRLGFLLEGTDALTDYYLNFTPSAIAGWDYTRLRFTERTGYCLTCKQWAADARGERVRLEEERSLSADEAHALLAHAQPRILHKTRTTFHGSLDGDAVTIVLDAVQLSGRQHYFLECETLTTPDRSHAARTHFLHFITHRLLHRDVSEAPTMLELLLQV